MYWAIDASGKEVSASKPGAWAWRLTCPVCRAPVFRRAGTARQAHFAHYGNTAKPACEFYTGGQVATQSQRATTPSTPRTAPRWTYTLAWYFLIKDQRGSVSLELRLPAIPDGISAGRIEVDTGMGIRAIDVRLLSRPQLVSVLPVVPGARLRGVDGASELAEALQLQASQLRANQNVFQAGESGGRLLYPEEPLEWATTYRILTTERLEPPALVGLVVKRTDWVRGWRVYEISLPAALPVSEGSRLERFFERTIRVPKPHLYLVDPQAHHVEADGTLIFPLDTRELIVGRTAVADVSVWCFPATPAPVEEISPDHVRVYGLGEGGFVIRQAGADELVGRIAECRLFRPRGVVLEKEDIAFPIFDRDSAARAGETFGYSGWALRVPTEKCTQIIQIEISEHRARPLAELSSIDLSRFSRLDASAFGCLNGFVGAKAPAPSASPPEATDTRRTVWLEGVVMAHHGTAALRSLRAAMRSNQLAGLPVTLRYLYAHISSVMRKGGS